MNLIASSWASFWSWLAELPQSSAAFLGTVTGSALGLLAILLGALFNAHLNRRRDDRLRREDRRAMVSALRAELATIRGILVENAERLTNADTKPEADHPFWVPDLSHTVLVLPHMLPKIGLLDRVTIRKVVTAYTLVQEYTESLLFLRGALEQDLPHDRQAVLMPAHQAENVAALNQSRATVLTEAIQALDHYAR
jgi:hypothetical protein